MSSNQATSQLVANSNMLKLATTQDFNTLDSEYNKSKDFNSLYDRPFSTLYLMVRSLKKENLDELLTEYNIPFNKKDKLDVKKQKVFENVYESQIIKYLLGNKTYMDDNKILVLKNELKKVCEQCEKCSVHNDNFNGNLNRIIRNPDTYTLEMLESQIDNLKKN